MTPQGLEYPSDALRPKGCVQRFGIQQGEGRDLLQDPGVETQEDRFEEANVLHEKV